MKFACETKPFSRACQTVARASATRSSVPALEGIKIAAADGAVNLCGYNLELGIQTSLAPEGTFQGGAVVLDAKMLCGIVKKLPDPLVDISTGEKGNVTIISGDARYEIVGMSASDYPEISGVGEGKQAEIPQPTLKDMIGQTAFAIDENNMSRPVFSGALFNISDGVLTTVGTDGYRLAICKERIDCTGSYDFVVPKNTLLEVAKLLEDDPDKSVRITVGARHASFTIGDYTVFTRLLEGEFLDYQKVIPTNYTTSTKISTRAFANSVDRVSIMVSDHLKSPIVCKFNHDDGAINLSCNTAIGAAADSVNAAEMVGGDLTIGFNDRYLLDALNHAGCDEVRLQLNGPLSPMAVLPDDGDSFLFLVLPVRLEAAP